MNSARVTVLIPTYNQSCYLEQAVASALKQDYPQLEVIVCDDASEDWDAQVLDTFAADPRLRIHRNAHNIGRVKNYQQGLYDLASGQWVLVLDGDDFLKDDAYVSTAMRIAASDPDIELVFSNAARLYDSSPDHYVAPHENTNLPTVSDGRALFLRLADEYVSIFHSTALYKRDKAMALDFYRSNAISSDWESLHRYILTGKVAFIATIASVWRIHGANATKNMSAKERSDNLQVIGGPYFAAKAAGVFEDATLDKWLYRRLWKTAFKDARTLIKAGDRQGLERYLRAVADISPTIARRVRYSPKLWLRRMRVYLSAKKTY
jgi:glycosyltransferase involved in cell wall biosynthesis